MSVKKWTFPGGERGVDIENSTVEHNDLTNSSTYHIDIRFKSSDDLIDLALEVDAARRKFGKDVKIFARISYFPYARQDRVMKDGESHSLKVIANFVNSLNIDRITVVDAHSDVVEALVDNLTIIPQHVALGCVLSTESLRKYDYFVAPDVGALKKIYKASSEYDTPVICAHKTREYNGFVKVSLPSEDFNKIKGSKVLVIDDICDGGRTFTELAKLFPLDCSADLYVTHGIFSKGKTELLQHYNEIFCYNDLSSN